MKSALQDDIAQESILSSGLLPLDIDQQEQFLTGVDLLAALTVNLDSSTLHFPQLQNLKLNLDKTEAVETGIKWINSSLITIIDTASSSESNNVLSQLIHLFQESKQIISNDISNDISSHLITILNCNNYPLLKQDICTILIDSEHPLNQLQSTNLTKLLNTEDSLCILDLLINKDLITAQTTQDFINVINKSTINSSEYILHKTYLLQIIDSFNEHPNLSTILSPQILDLFKTHHDITFLKQIQKIIKDPLFFAPIYEEIHTKLQNFNRLLEIETIADGDLSEKDKESLKILLNLDNSYITKTAYASIFKLPDIKTLLAPNHTGYSKNDCAKLFLSVQKDLLQVLKYSNNLDDYLLNEYDQYCIKFSENPSIVHKGNYSKLLSNNIHACNQILFNRQTLSDECAKVLIDTLNDNISSSIDATQNASNIIFTLIKHNKLSPESSAKAINILKEMKAEDRFVSLNISKSFECLAKQNIIDDDFTQAVCTNHLHSSKIPTQILQGLEAILNYSGSIPNEATTAIVKFAQDIDNQTKLRLKAVNILCRTPLSIEEEDISNISSLLKGDFNHTIPLDTFNNNYDGELTLDYQKLDLYAHQNGLQITGRMQIGNAFFDSISEQISTFDKKKSAEDIYQTTKKELALFKNKYPSINIEEYDKAIGNGLLLDDSIIQATANALGVTINLYNYSGYVITKIPELKLDEKSIDIGITETRYWPLTANIETEYILSDDDLSTKASDSEERDYRVATATIKLLVDYAKIHNKLPQIAISALEETLSNELIVKDSISALIDILNHNPNIFKEDQLTQFKTLNSTISKQIEFSASLESLWSMLNNYNSHDSIDHQETDLKENLLIELNHIFELLISTNQENIGNLYSIITKILQTEPELFVKCLQIIKLNPPTKHYIPEHQQVIDQLVIASDASYQDLCWLANNNCYSEKLQQSIAKYLDENINSIQTEESILATTIEAIKYLAINGDGLDTKSIHHLITLSQNIPQQTLNIVRALNINSQALDTDDFNNLEKFFTHDDKSLIQSLATLFANHSKYLTLPESIDAIFQALVKYNFNRVDSQIYLNILKEDARYEALSLLKLEFSNDVQEKLQTLSEIDNLPIRLVTLKSILKLLKNIELSTTCIQVLAHVADQLFTLLPNSKIDLGTSEIIYKYKDELKKEYLKLESVLTLDVNMFVINQQHENLQKALSARFTNIHVTNTYLNEMSLLYKDYSDDVQFIDNVLLKNALNKAKYISEYNLFLEFINKYSIPSEEIAVTLDKNDLLDSINIFETNLLTRNLNQLYDQINQNDNLLYSIKQHCYQLKTSGWSLDSLQTILKKVTQDNTLSVDKILNSLIKYNIKEEERDKKGWCFLDIIQNINSTDLLDDRELDRKIHDIFVNKFEYKLENKSTNLLNKISDLNPDFAQRYPDYQHTLNTMHRLYNNGLDDEKDPIKDWDKNKVHDWVTNLKSSLLKVNSSSEQSDLDINQNNPNSPDLGTVRK